MRRRFMINQFAKQSMNQIWYTSANGNVVIPYATDVFGANIVSNTYSNGKGIIKFGGDVTLVGYRAFIGCSSLTSINIPDSVTRIEDEAFAGCSSLTSIYFKATTPPILGEIDVFVNNASGRKIYVPYQSLDAYKTATNWSEYADDIIGYDFENDTVVGYVITFTVNGIECQAEEGMTWEEYCNSQYNLGTFQCNSNQVLMGKTGVIDGQTPSDVICNGCVYSLQ